MHNGVNIVCTGLATNIFYIGTLKCNPSVSKYMNFYNHQLFTVLMVLHAFIVYTDNQYCLSLYSQLLPLLSMYVWNDVFTM